MTNRIPRIDTDGDETLDVPGVLNTAIGDSINYADPLWWARTPTLTMFARMADDRTQQQVSGSGSVTVGPREIRLETGTTQNSWAAIGMGSVSLRENDAVTAAQTGVQFVGTIEDARWGFIGDVGNVGDFDNNNFCMWQYDGTALNVKYNDTSTSSEQSATIQSSYSPPSRPRIAIELDTNGVTVRDDNGVVGTTSVTDISLYNAAKRGVVGYNANPNSANDRRMDLHFGRVAGR